MIERNGYTLLDLLSDVGGLQGILISGISLTLSLANYNHLDNFLVFKLFRSPETEAPLQASSSENIREFFFDKCIPRKLACCAKKRKQVAMEKAREALMKEIEVIKLIRSRRFVHMALKHLLGPALRKDFKARSLFKEIRIDETKLPQTAGD